MQTQILGLLTPVMTLLFAAMFVTFWRAGRMKRYVLGFGIAYVLAATAFLITHFAPAGAIYVFHVTQVFYSMSAVVLLASVCERAGQRFQFASFALVYAVSALALGVAVSLSNDVSARLIIVNMGYGVMFAIGATILLGARRRSMFDIAIIGIMALHAADHLVRPTMTLLFEQSIAAELYRDSIYYSLIGLVLGVKGVGTAIVLIGATIADWTIAIRESSERDSLTGLHNRGSFEETFRKLLSRAHQEKRPISLVVADIDHFKQVNDIWGHQAGDQAISSFGQLISTMVRECDVAGRIGGEEFCIAVWDCDSEPANRLAERIRMAFSGLRHAGLNDDVRLTASFGVASTRAGEHFDQLFARADEALYRAKSKGRDRVECAERYSLEEGARGSLPAFRKLQKLAAEG